MNPSVSDRIFRLYLAFVLDSLGEFYKNRSSDRETLIVPTSTCAGSNLWTWVKEQVGVNREEPTDAFSSIREEFSSTRRIEPLTG